MGLVSTGGDFFSNNTGQLSVSIGELVTETYSNSTHTLTQGFQQTGLVVTSLGELSKVEQLRVFPNPSSDFVVIATSQDQEYEFRLFDSQARGIVSGRLTGTSTKLILKNYAKGLYFLELRDRAGVLHSTHKIIKR